MRDVSLAGSIDCGEALRDGPNGFTIRMGRFPSTDNGGIEGGRTRAASVFIPRRDLFTQWNSMVITVRSYT